MKINNFDPITGQPSQRSQSVNQMIPASQPSGSVQDLKPGPSRVQPTGADVQMQNLIRQYDQTLEEYSIENLFDYERACKQIFMRGLIQAPHPSSSYTFKNQQDRRAQMQKLMNFKFLKFQMKEKELKKEIFRKKQKEFEMREIEKLKEYPKSVDPRQEDDLGFQYITKSRRKAVDPLQALKDNSLGRIKGHALPIEKGKSLEVQDQLTEQGQNPYQNINLQNQAIQEQPIVNKPQLQQLAYAPQNQIPPQAQQLTAPYSQIPMAKPQQIQEFPPQVLPVGRNLEPQDCSGFLARFSNDDFIKQQKINLQKIQKQVLEQQIKEKQLKRNQDKLGDVKAQNQQARNYSKERHARRQSHFSQEQQPLDNKEFLREVPGEQINYLANSNNLHEVFGTQYDRSDPLRNNVNAVVRGGSPDNSRQMSPNELPPAGNFRKQSVQPESLEQQMNYQRPPQTDVAQNMHIQAMDFIGVLKDLIQDTVQQQRQINQNMFPNQYNQYQHVEPQFQNYHEQQQQLLAQQVQDLLPPQVPQEETVPEPTIPRSQALGNLQVAAAKHTQQIQSYIQEIGGLQQQKERLILEESSNLLEQRGREPQLRGFSKNQTQEELEKEIDAKIDADQRAQQGLQPKGKISEENLPKSKTAIEKTLTPEEIQNKIKPLDQTFAGNEGFQIDQNAPSVLAKELPAQLQEQKTMQQATMPMQLQKKDSQPTVSKPEEKSLNNQQFQRKQVAQDEKKKRIAESKAAGGDQAGADDEDPDKEKGPDKDGKVGYAHFRARPVRLKDEEERKKEAAEARELREQHAAGMAEAHGANLEFDHARNFGPNGEAEVKQKVKSLVEEETKARQKAEEEEQRRLENDFLNETGQSRFNMAQDTQLPSQKINQRLMEQVWNNFEKYDDFQIFEKGVPSSVLKPLRQDLTNNPEYPNPYRYRELIPPDVYDPDIPKDEQHAPIGAHEIQQRLIRQTFNPTYSIFDARMRENIDNVMKENFEFEQKTIETLFNRYQQYKPLVSGVYGQDVVHTSEHLVDNGKDENLPADVKSYETQELIERMKGNYRMGAIDLAERYSTIEDAHQMFNGRPRPEAIDIIEKEPPADPEKNLSANDILDPTVKGFRFDMIKQRNDSYFKKEEGINLGTVDETFAENEEEKKADKTSKILNPSLNAIFPISVLNQTQKDPKTEIDSQKIQDRILSLKLMFEDTKTLRLQKDFLNSKGANVLTTLDKPDNIDLIQQFNTDKQLQNQLLGTRIGAGLENEPNQKGTRMISSIIKEVKEQKAQMEQNTQLQQDFEGHIHQKKDIFKTSEFFQPGLSAAGEELNAIIPESVAQKVAPTTKMPEGHPLAVLQNDFRFDFNEYDAHRQQIRDEAIKKNSQNDEQIQDLIAKKLDVKPTEPETILDQLVDQSKDLQIQQIVEENKSIKKPNALEGHVKIVGTDFTYKPVVDEVKEQEEPIGDRTLTTEPKEPNYGFLARNVYVEQLGDPNKELSTIKDIFLFRTKDGANTDQMFKLPDKKQTEPEPITFGQEALDPVVHQAKKAFDVPIFADYQPYVDNRDKLGNIQKALANKSVFNASDDPTFQGQLDAQRMDHIQQKKLEILLQPPDGKILQNKLDMKTLNEQLTEIKEKQMSAQDAQIGLTISLNQKEVEQEMKRRQNEPQLGNFQTFRGQAQAPDQKSLGSQRQPQKISAVQNKDPSKMFLSTNQVPVTQSESGGIQSPKFNQQTPSQSFQVQPEAKDQTQVPESEPATKAQQPPQLSEQNQQQQPLSQPVQAQSVDEPLKAPSEAKPESQEKPSENPPLKKALTVKTVKSDSVKNGSKEPPKLQRQQTEKARGSDSEGPEFNELLQTKTRAKQSSRQSEREQLRIDMLKRIEKKKISDLKSSAQSQLEGGQQTKRESLQEKYQTVDVTSMQNQKNIPKLDIDDMSLQGSLNNFEPPSSTRSQKQLNVLKDPRLNSLRRMHSQSSLDGSLQYQRIPPIQKEICAQKPPKFTKTGSKNQLPPLSTTTSLQKKLKTLNTSNSDPNLSGIISKKIQQKITLKPPITQPYTQKQTQNQFTFQQSMKESKFQKDSFNFNQDPEIQSKIKIKQKEYKQGIERDDGGQEKVKRVKLRIKKYQNSFINDVLQQS